MHYVNTLIALVKTLFFGEVLHVSLYKMMNSTTFFFYTHKY